MRTKKNLIFSNNLKDYYPKVLIKRKIDMKQIISVLSIAGSDSCGGAGIEADLKTISSLGLYACCAITAVTSQNTKQVKDIFAVPSNIVESQIDCVLEDFDVSAIKIGMIYNKDNVFAIKNSLLRNNFSKSIILDPVLVATSGSNLATKELLFSIKQELFPISQLITPNLSEAEAIVGKKIKDIDSMIEAGKEIIKSYKAKNVLIKGGHLENIDMTDVLVMNDMSVKMFNHKKINSNNTHGTGCTLSSAIACFCCLNDNNIETSVSKAKEYVTNAIDNSKELNTGHGHGSLNHLFCPQKLIIK